MRFFIAIISRNREALCATLVDKASHMFTPFPTFQGICVVQHMEKYPTLSLIQEQRLKRKLLLLFDSDELDPVRRGLGRLRDMAITEGSDRFLSDPQEDDYVLVLDDDIDPSAMASATLFSAVKILQSDAKGGMVQLGHKDKSGLNRLPVEEHKVCTTGGGLVVRLSAYLDPKVGGYGQDYFDTPELSIRMLEGGYETYRLNSWFGRHNYQKSGGLKELFPDKKNCNEMRHLSQIISLYPDTVKKDPDAWLGFSMIS